VAYLNTLLVAVDSAADAAQTAADDAQQAADDAQTAAEAAQAAADLAAELAAAAQDTANEAIAPDTFTPSHSASAVNTGATATAYCRWNSDGTKERKANGGSYIAAGNWYNPTTGGIGTTHWIKFTVLSEMGGTITGTTGSWLQLSSARTLELARTTTGEATATATVSIATDSLGATVVATGTVGLYATYET
jgi:hypothetical protein